MEKELERLFSELSPEEAEGFEASFDSFGESEVSSDEQDRILSSVMRKAGFEMEKKNITVNKAKKNTKRIIMLIAAAVVMSVGAVGAGAYYKGYRLEDGQIIRKFGGEKAEEVLESQGVTKVQNEQNDNFDISMYAFLSDGNYCQAYWRVEALDEAAAAPNHNDLSAHVQAYYADTGERIEMGGTVSWPELDMNDESHYYFVFKMPLKYVDISRDIEFRLRTNSNTDDSPAEALRFVVNASPNVETKTIANENGTELILSPFGATQKFKAGEEYPDNIKEYKLINSDGSYVTLDNPWSYGTSNDDEYGEYSIFWDLHFGNIIDLSEIDGISIDGDDYIDINK